MSKAEQIAQQYTTEKLWQNFDTLPDLIKTLLLSPETSEIIDKIAQSNGLPSKADKILRYTDLILAGIVPITLLKQTFQEEFGIREELARKIALEIRDKIFMQVKDELRAIHGLK